MIDDIRQPATQRPFAPAAVALLLLAVAIGCSDDDVPLIGTEWVLRSAVVDGIEVYPALIPSESTLRFGVDTFQGDDGCDAYGGTIDVVGPAVSSRTEWGLYSICLIVTYRPLHLGRTFLVDVDGSTLTVTGEGMVHVYDAR